MVTKASLMYLPNAHFVCGRLAKKLIYPKLTLRSVKNKSLIPRNKIEF